MTDAQMNRYILLDVNWNQFQLTEGTLQPFDDAFPIDVDVIERSFTLEENCSSPLHN